MNEYEEQGLTLEKAIHFAANDELPYLRKRLKQEFAQFLIEFYELQEDPIQQQIPELARTIRNQYDMNQTDSIRQSISLRKVSKGAKIRNRYNRVPHLTQNTNGKVTNSQKTPQTRAKRSALSQQVTTKQI